MKALTVGAPPATELAEIDATELATGVDETAREEAATDAGATLLAGATDEAAWDAGVDPPPPPPPPQAVKNPPIAIASSNLDVFINRSLLII
jgi:hypothetical protein